MDALEILQATTSRPLNWVSPRNGADVHPLGYVLGGTLKVQGATLTVPAGAVVAGNHFGGLVVEGGHLDDSAGGAVFTNIADPALGLLSCDSACDLGTPDLGGISVTASSTAKGTATIVGATFRHFHEWLNLSGGAVSGPTDVRYGFVVKDSLFDGVLLSSSGTTDVERCHFLRTGLQVAGVNLVDSTFDGSPLLGGITIHGGGSTATVERNLIDTAGAMGPVAIDHVSSLDFRNNTFTNSGAAPTTDPVVTVASSTADLSSAFSGTTSNGTAGDSVGLGDVTAPLSFRWQTPTKGTSARPLGFVINRGNLFMGPGATLTVPASGIVKVGNGGITLQGGALDASAGGAVFTSLYDPNFGPSLCPGPACGQHAAPGDWAGIQSMSGPGAIVLRGALLQFGYYPVFVTSGQATVVCSTFAGKSPFS